jgi:DNA-binding transcriptional ArsR family regulator
MNNAFLGIKNKGWEDLSQLMRLLGQPVRLQILLAIGDGEACVCHLEAALGERQAYISQQLMALREAGLVTSHRNGRNIFYRLKDHELLKLIELAAKFSGINSIKLASLPSIESCPCPHCNNTIPEEKLL